MATNDRSAPEVLTIGETMGLVTPTQPEPLADATDFRLEVAGAESNVAVHLARRKHHAAWASLLGDDPIAERIVNALGRNGVDTSFAHRVAGERTGVFFKDPGQDSSTLYYYRDGSAASHMGPAFLETLPLEHTRIVHLTGITAALSTSCLAMIEELWSRVRASDAQAKLSFDVNYRSRLWSADVAGPTLKSLAERADILFVGRDEAEDLWGLPTADDIRAAFPQVPAVVVKDADVGATLFTAETRVFVAAPKVEVVEVVGAGDGFAGGFLSGYLDGIEPAEMLSRGHQVAAHVLVSTSDIGEEIEDD